MAVKKFISQNIFAILLAVGLFLSPFVFGGFIVLLENYPNSIEIEHGNTSEAYDVVAQFGTSLIRNNFNSAKEVLTPEALEKFVLWVKDHTEIKDCKSSLKFENNGSRVGMNWSSTQGGDKADFEYWCRDYNISVTNIKIKKENNHFWIVDWDMPKEEFRR
jgi:hypothetical protein